MHMLDIPALQRLVTTPPAGGAGTPGLVTLVGAGPGDPELLTVKAARALQQATLVLHDHLVGDGVLDLVPAGAMRLYVGKESSNHTLPQQGIIELMVRLAREGRGTCHVAGEGSRVRGGGRFRAEKWGRRAG